MNDSILGNVLAIGAIGLCLLLLSWFLSTQVLQTIAEQQEVVIGMTSNFVIKAWGEPDHITTSEVRKAGYDFVYSTIETWTYDNPARTVVFEDGFVTRVEQVKY